MVDGLAVFSINYQPLTIYFYALVLLRLRGMLGPMVVVRNALRKKVPLALLGLAASTAEIRAL